MRLTLRYKKSVRMWDNCSTAGRIRRFRRRGNGKFHVWKMDEGRGGGVGIKRNIVPPM